MAQERDSTQLHEAILTSHDISCDNCKKTESAFNIDDFDACDVFYENGWRMRSKVYCPDCAKKKLKRLD